MKTKQRITLENTQDHPRIVKLEDMPDEQTALLVAAKFRFSENDTSADYDYRDNVAAVRDGSIGQWIQLTCGREAVHYVIDGDYVNRDYVTEAWVRLLSPGERLVIGVEEVVPEPVKEKHIEELMPETLKADGIVILGLLTALKPHCEISNSDKSLDHVGIVDVVAEFIGGMTNDQMDGLISRFKARVEEGPMVRPESLPLKPKDLEINCIVACHGRDGPALYKTTVCCTPDEYESGDHYEVAKRFAEEDDFDGPFVVFDENDGPSQLFACLFPPKTA